ncbi:hypothetical protein BC938DRAFT_471019 [Jimgerdemannia flammicorona]|uniref:Uncharacterized protein n=1 Tax=Jimgerdemannia flammicorona TaxID=994334 RepID=A0A433QUV8_9FUNG|nr:hypothetical protein BC938DRAFT_471019 [Jimgerdemannia flammicorona]
MSTSTPLFIVFADNSMQLLRDPWCRVPNALPGRESCEIEIFGMEGIPEEDQIAHQAALDAKDNPPSKRQKFDTGGNLTELTPEQIQAQLAQHQALAQATPQSFPPAPYGAPAPAGGPVPPAGAAYSGYFPPPRPGAPSAAPAPAPFPGQYSQFYQPRPPAGTAATQPYRPPPGQPYQQPPFPPQQPYGYRSGMQPAPYPAPGGPQQWAPRPGVSPPGQSPYSTGSVAPFRPPSSQAPPTGPAYGAPPTSQPPYSSPQAPQQPPYGPAQGYPYSQASPTAPASSTPTSQPPFAPYSSGPYLAPSSTPLLIGTAAAPTNGAVPQGTETTAQISPTEKKKAVETLLIYDDNEVSPVGF